MRSIPEMSLNTRSLAWLSSARSARVTEPLARSVATTFSASMREMPVRMEAASRNSPSPHSTGMDPR